ncbi:palmitoyltransferase ZDHHC20-B isoform X1 [Drosophila subpulchrella]|uniref:palmitoyltransferase ZDHHC20-B isoform X1 n=1 Tax=Drosophila subpulchrella TaxID=1486046 RepID=UPI0018A148C1|nr:palmitoyltransferase ZDHHC20-B isoform X1 [Drosophila subpulchrella]
MGNDEHRRRKTPCGFCMAVFKWIPVLFITAVIAWSYYAYVVELCIRNTQNTIGMIFMLLFYHLFLTLFMWSYWRTIMTSVGRIPDQWRIPDEEVTRLFRADSPDTQKRILNNFARDLPVTNRTMNGSVRFCEKCKIIKPDRAHHCSVCSCCVLKMDHHCPWVNNCVNFYNYKYFVLFLGYALVYCLYVAFTSLHDFVDFWKVGAYDNNGYSAQGQLNASGMGRFHILFLFFIAIMFAISLVSLFGYHIYLVLMNRTTLESFRAPIFRVGGPDKNGYNLGRYANFCEVFGDDWQYWLLPVFSSRGSGYSYPTSSDQSRVSTASPVQRYDAMGDTATSRLDGNPTDKLIGASPLDSTNHHHNPSPHQVRSTSAQPSQQLQLQVQPPPQFRDELDERPDQLANGQSLNCSTAAVRSSQAADGAANGAAVYIDMIGDHPLAGTALAKDYPRPPNGDLPV